MIYRVVGESSEWVWSEESGAMEISLSLGRLMGAFNAGVADEAWGDLPMPMLSNPRVRFWFTERGEVVGRFIAPLTLRGRQLARVIAEASKEFMASGILVVQDKIFTGIADFEVGRRVSVVERFKASIGGQHSPRS